MPLSLAEEARSVVGIDPAERFPDAGARLGRERGLHNLHFLLADGMALPFRDASFDLVLSHAVIEHVEDAPRYLREWRSSNHIWRIQPRSAQDPRASRVEVRLSLAFPSPQKN